MKKFKSLMLAALASAALAAPSLPLKVTVVALKLLNCCWRVYDQYTRRWNTNTEQDTCLVMLMRN